MVIERLARIEVKLRPFSDLFLFVDKTKKPGSLCLYWGVSKGLDKVDDCCKKGSAPQCGFLRSPTLVFMWKICE